MCRREIAFYQKRQGAKAICWENVASADGAPPADDLCRDAALKRFHVRTPDGRLVSGGLAFAELWAAMPGFGPVGRVLRMRPFVWFLEIGYRAFLPIRPVLQRFFA